MITNDAHKCQLMCIGYNHKLLVQLTYEEVIQDLAYS